MQNIARRLILSLASAIGLWLLVSFAGAMVNSANAAFWSDSLMWSLLSCLIIAPALLMVNDLLGSSPQESSQPSRSSTSRSSTSADERTAFIEKESEEVRTLWSESDAEQEWPPQETAQEERDRIRA